MGHKQTNSKATVPACFQNNRNSNGIAILQTPQKVGYPSMEDHVSISPWLFQSPGTAGMYSLPQNLSNNRLPFKTMTPTGTFYPRYNPSFSNNSSHCGPLNNHPHHFHSHGLATIQNWQARK